jgi:hypothetical protein
MLVRWSFPLDLAELNLRGYVPPVGPVLDGFDHDRFLLTLARGLGEDRLELAFRLLDDGAAGSDDGPVELGLWSLVPGATYRVHGTVGGEGGRRVDIACAADGDGRATVVLDGPLGGGVRLVVERQP